MKKKTKIKRYTVKEIRNMPLYEFECDTCETSVDMHIPTENRNDHRTCPVCSGLMRRKFTAPTVFIGTAGAPHEGRSDEFWERSERKKQKDITKKQGVEKEKIRFGDKHTLGKLENAHNNYARMGEAKKAEGVAKKMDNKRYEKKIQVVRP